MRDLSKADCSYDALRRVFIALFNAKTAAEVKEVFRVDGPKVGYKNASLMLIGEATPLSKLTDDAPAIERELELIAIGDHDRAAIAAMFVGTSLEAEARAFLQVGNTIEETYQDAVANAPVAAVEAPKAEPTIEAPKANGKAPKARPMPKAPAEVPASVAMR